MQSALFTPDQIRAIRAYAGANGRYWKRRLIDLWANGSTDLRWLRNKLGPSSLLALRLADLDDSNTHKGATTTTPVVFRVDRQGEVFALFPTLAADDSGHVTSYQHIGQHSAADYGLCIAKSKPATPAQYAALLQELTGRGYSLRVVRRRLPTTRPE